MDSPRRAQSGWEALTPTELEVVGEVCGGRSNPQVAERLGIMAFIGAVVGEPNFDNLTLDVGDGVVRYGALLTAVANFLLIAVALFFVVRVAERFFRQEEKKEPTEIELLTEIRDELRTFG